MVSPFGSVAEQIVGSMVGVMDLMSGALFVAGLAFIVRGALRFNAFIHAPNQNPLSESARFVLLGVFAINMPAALNLALDTVGLSRSPSQVAQGAPVPPVLAPPAVHAQAPQGSPVERTVDSVEKDAPGAIQWTTERSIK